MEGVTFFDFLLQIASTVYRERLAGDMFGEFGELSMICQTKTIQINIYN